MGLWLVSRLVTPARSRLSLGSWFLTGPLVGFLGLSTVGIPFAVDPLFAGYQTLRLLLLFCLYLFLVNLSPDRGQPGPFDEKGEAPDAGQSGAKKTAFSMRSVVAWSMAGAMVLQALVALPQFLMDFA